MSSAATQPETDCEANSLAALQARLQERAQDGEDAKISFQGVLDAVGGEAQPPLLLTLALPMCVPMPPGIPTLAGALITVVALTWLLGRPAGERRASRLPRRLADAQVGAAPLAKWVGRVERLVSPLSGDHARALLGWERSLAAILAVLLGIAMLLPIPLMNIPQALGVVGLSLAALDSSPRLFRIGAVFATVVLALSGAVSFGLVAAGGAVLGL